MKISVIVPVFNVEQYLMECIESIVSQDFLDFEVICVEDCSSDNSAEILRKYEAKYQNIKVLWHERNLGLSAARNTGMEYASGEYILFVDSDDFLEAGALKRLYDAAENKYDIVYFNKRVIYEANWSGSEPTNKKYYNPLEGMSGRDMFVWFMKQDSMKSLNAYTQFFRTDFLKLNQLKFYDGLIHEDYLFFFQCAVHAKRTIDINETLYVYRKRNHSLTTYISENHKRSIFYTFSEILFYWKSHEWSKDEDNAIRIFLGKVYLKCVQYREATSYRGGLEYGDATDNFLYELMMNTENVEFTKDEWSVIRNAGCIWIYGAGRVARELVQVFEQNQIQASGVIVSDKSKSRGYFMGWQVRQVDEISFKNSDVVIIAIADRIVVKNVISVLDELGVKTIIKVKKYKEVKENDFVGRR